MTKDRNKNIAEITYNHLNLPKKITIGGAKPGTITYIYSANGEKLKKTVTEGSKTHNTDYLDGFQYKQGRLSFFPTTSSALSAGAEGYANVPYQYSTSGPLLTFYNYVYNYTDHLGNIRLRYTKDPQAETGLKILEEDHYYPFGLKHKGYNNEHNIFHPPIGTPHKVVIVPITPDLSDPYKYKYQGQERQDELGLNWDSFKWRNYDYAIGRFMSVDPLAEDYSYQSPYNFSENRVIDAYELEGLEAVIIHGTTQKRTGHSFSKEALDQLQRIGGNTVRNESFRWNAPLTNTNTGERALAAKQLTSHVTELRNNLIQGGTISADEPITLVGYSHGGNVGTQAADLIHESTGLKVNLLTVSTPAYKTHKSLEKAGLTGLEDPNKKTSISSHIQVVHENDAVTSFWAQGSDTYDTFNAVHPVKNYVIKQEDVSLKGGIKSHTKLPFHRDFAKYLKQIPKMINPDN